MSKEREALKLALKDAEGIVNSDWRKWEELASPQEFEAWVKRRALHMAGAIKAALAQPAGRNFCPRCGKRLASGFVEISIHKCTPPKEKNT